MSMHLSISKNETDNKWKRYKKPIVVSVVVLCFIIGAVISSVKSYEKGYITGFTKASAEVKCKKVRKK